ncbi:glucan biosynthesis protein [Salinisphaera sp.]|uniref:glucan biosynthesis protein n=1 Tax=Salinisphaera sp. TaxID=1914330 RepID=UPI002D7748E2|nr:glucan biosynthesis protein [Salinisphaera sp.]HET7314452.1 glucan biosynthesis protein [Salinisphaera sp.]
MLKSTLAWAGAGCLSGLPNWARAAGNPLSGGRPFSFDRLIAHARELAALPYIPRQPRHADLLDSLGYETFMGIRTRDGHQLWEGTARPFIMGFFHLDNGARTPVDINIVADGRATRLAYDPHMFVYPEPGLAQRLPPDLGYAGFRLYDARTDYREWLAFKGASYFRSPGTENQYGMSARGVSVNTGEPEPESFPDFTRFWIERPAPGDDEITIWALLEGEHLTGAYRMRCRRPGDVIMDIQTRLFQRKAIDRLGIAPLTSMFWFSQINARRGRDWRPEVHDSDGLAIATGAGERIWRVLNNPPRPDISLFADRDPRGFGLLQRDRNFDHYQDSAVSFERRPGTWVEPAGGWGDGRVALFAFPTSKEIYDNINAFWIPSKAATANARWAFDYRLSWTDDPPFPADLAQVVTTRTGRAGDPGSYAERKPTDRKFVIDFVGGPIGRTPPGDDIVIDAGASFGRIDNPYVIAIGSGERGWRVFIDWVGEVPPDRQAAVLRCRLRRGDTVLTETWVNSYYPQPMPGG